jgi:SAM-dependent methyltransferase
VIRGPQFDNQHRGRDSGTIVALLRLFIVSCAIPPSMAGQIFALRRPDVVYVPTPERVVHAMLHLAGVTPADVVYDLGSGDGRIPIAAAREFGARGVGIEIDPNRIREAAANLAKSGLAPGVTFLNQDLFDADISAATVVTLFMSQGVNLKVMPKLKRELRPGARVVSLHFDMGDTWPPEQAQDVDGLMLYLWTIRQTP